MAKQILPEFVSSKVIQGEYVFIDLTPKKSSSMTVICSGREICGAEYHINRKEFPYYCIEYVSQGNGTVVLNGQEHDISTGDMFFYGPGIEHEIYAKPHQRLVKYFVDFIGERASSLIKTGPLNMGVPLHFTDNKVILEIFKRLQVDGKNQRRNYRQIARLQIELLLLRAQELALPIRDVESMSWSSYQKCLQYIEENCLWLRGIDTVAHECDLSEPYICRIFRKYHNTPPYKYLIKCKMSHAASLLLGDDLLVKEISARVGFDDPYHFSKAFKKYYGVSPDKFRERR